MPDSLGRVAGFDGAAPELEIDVYNMNEGRNSGILEARGEPKGYAHFARRVRLHEKELAARGGKLSGGQVMKTAIRLAIRGCKNANPPPRNFWENMSQEELNMLVNEWDMDTALEVREEEGFERGVEKGRMEGVESVAANALAKGYSIEQVHEITGLDAETIAGLSKKVR